MSLQSLRAKFAGEPAGTQLIDQQDVLNRAILGSEELVYYYELEPENLVSLKWTATDLTLEQAAMVDRIIDYIVV